MQWISYIPKSYLSWFVGTMANLPLPKPFSTILVRWFARAYKIDSSLATRPLEAFSSIGSFFTRDLRPEVRPVGEGIVSPVDGTLRSAQDVSTIGDVTLVKGRTYSIAGLLGNDPLAARFANGQVWNFYLSPQDAHHIFSPVDGAIVRSVHVPGKLWPVNDWAIAAVDGLFVVNERVISFIETSNGMVAVVMVGATNVGRIALSYAPVESNRAPWRTHHQRSFDHSPAIPVDRGEKIGTFKMGSTVVLVFEGRRFDTSKAGTQVKVTYGSPLSALCPEFVR
jgi:phosphatidylserine decarboxylase